MKGPDTEAIFSVACSSDILEQHNKKLSTRDICFRSWVFSKQLDLLEYRNDVIRLCRHFRSNADSCYWFLHVVFLAGVEEGPARVRADDGDAPYTPTRHDRRRPDNRRQALPTNHHPQGARHLHGATAVPRHDALAALQTRLLQVLRPRGVYRCAPDDAPQVWPHEGGATLQEHPGHDVWDHQGRADDETLPVCRVLQQAGAARPAGGDTRVGVRARGRVGANRGEQQQGAAVARLVEAPYVVRLLSEVSS